MNGLSLPNMNPQPSNIKPSDETAKTIKFLDKILTVFFARAKPASTDANPRFMKKTRIAARNTHKVSIIIVVSTISPPQMNKNKKDKGARFYGLLCPCANHSILRF